MSLTAYQARVITATAITVESAKYLDDILEIIKSTAERGYREISQIVPANVYLSFITTELQELGYKVWVKEGRCFGQIVLMIEW